MLFLSIPKSHSLVNIHSKCCIFQHFTKSCNLTYTINECKAEINPFTYHILHRNSSDLHPNQLSLFTSFQPFILWQIFCHLISQFLKGIF